MSSPVTRITNALYGASGAVRAFELANPQETVLAAGACKGLHLDTPDEVRRGPRWVTARRGTLIATKTEILCGDWSIPFGDIERLTYISIPSLFSRALVLKVWLRTGGQFHFGLQNDPRWLTQLPLVPEREASKVLWSVFSVALRVGVLGYLAWDLLT